MVIEKTDKRQWTPVATREISTIFKTKSLHDGRSQALDQVAQKGGRISILGDIQMPSGQDPEQPALYLETVLLKLSFGLETSRSSPLPKWFCNASKSASNKCIFVTNYQRRHSLIKRVEGRKVNGRSWRPLKCTEKAIQLEWTPFLMRRRNHINTQLPLQSIVVFFWEARVRLCL